MGKKKYRHILGLSGGKDSTALAIYMRDKVPDMEYIFCDTYCELEETYEYLDKVESFLGKKIIRLTPEKTFKQYLEVYSNYLPSVQARWCTQKMKIFPYEDYVGDDYVYSYIGIRADENRDGYISDKTNITPVYPFKEDGLVLADVNKILDDSGMGLPDYYEWRSRSGCYFCFFQRPIEWVGLLERHPELFAKAEAMEKVHPETGTMFTWVEGRPLDYIRKNKESIKSKFLKREERRKTNVKARTLFELVHDTASPAERACVVCDL